MSTEPETLFNTIFNNLSPQDKNTYFSLKKAFAQPIAKNRRSKSTDAFCEIINSLKLFVLQGQNSDSNRAFVCGICFFDDVIAVNTRYLRILISKSKSSINGLFQSMSYGTLPFSTDYQTQLIKFFPFLKENYGELRQWTFRQKIDNNSLPYKEIIQQQIQTINNPKNNNNQFTEEFITPPPNPMQPFNDSISTATGGKTEEKGIRTQDEVPSILNDYDLLANFGDNDGQNDDYDFDFLGL